MAGLEPAASAVIEVACLLGDFEEHILGRILSNLVRGKENV